MANPGISPFYYGAFLRIFPGDFCLAFRWFQADVMLEKDNGQYAGVTTGTKESGVQ